MNAYRKLALLREVIVNLDDGSAISGVLIGQVGVLVHLKTATLLEPGMAPTPLDGDVMIERARVRFIQAP